MIAGQLSTPLALVVPNKALVFCTYPCFNVHAIVLLPRRRDEGVEISYDCGSVVDSTSSCCTEQVFCTYPCFNAVVTQFSNV